VVAAQLVRASDGLCQGIVGGSCGVHFYGRGARGREDLSGCHGEGKDVGDVGCMILDL
jgi:hypothetical protein